MGCAYRCGISGGLGMDENTVNISAHFTLGEFTASELAARNNIDNTPPPDQVANLKRLAAVMEDVRAALGGKSIYITSGYRCSKLNKLVGSKPTSAHVNGMACDFKCPSYGTPKDIVEALQAFLIPYDQLILEFYNPTTGDGWVHIGLGSNPRRQVLTINSMGTFSGAHV